MKFAPNFHPMLSKHKVEIRLPLGNVPTCIQTPPNALKCGGCVLFCFKNLTVGSCDTDDVRLISPFFLMFTLRPILDPHPS